MPAVFAFDSETGALTLRGQPADAPWLHFIGGHAKNSVVRTLSRNDGTEHLDEKKPWWYCKLCYTYWLPPAGRKAHASSSSGANVPGVAEKDLLERMPMRNYWEGHFTRWHVDLGFVHLRPYLAKAYPELVTLPSVEDALDWQTAYDQLVQKLRSLPEQGAARRVAESEVARQRKWLDDKEWEWSPPPHKSSWKTPVPQRFYDAAAGRHKPWRLLARCSRDLVPHEQAELVQDVANLAELQCVSSADARACISLCRPVGYFTQKRKLGGRGGTVSTQTHQSGELCLRPLTPEEDETRGMLSGIVAKPEILSSRFRLREEEVKALHRVLPWLRRNNPWFQAYRSSLQEVSKCWDFVRELSNQGRLMAVVPGNMPADDDRTISEHLGNEDLAAFMPLEDLKAAEGTYRHMRAAAHVICTAQLSQPLPEAWRDVHKSDLTDSQGQPFRVLPQAMRTNMTFTNVSFRDPHADAKVFVRQFPHGTGSYRSSLDCVSLSRARYRLQCFWSLDGVFLDDADPEWMFWQRESEYKWRLYNDYLGRPHRNSSAAPVPAEQEHGGGAQTYSHQRFSVRVGAHIPESNQALTKTKHDWLEMAREHNLGSPTAMTTVVAHVKTSNILAHVRRGPCARPDPEDTVAFLYKRPQQGTLFHNCAIQTADYLRRRRELETYAYCAGYDSLRGRMRALTRRREGQKRGPNHDHYNEFAEPCGVSHAYVPLKSGQHDLRAHGVNLPGGIHRFGERACRSASRWCLQTGQYCRLPEECDGKAFHILHHNAPATAELCRPYPVGSVVQGPPAAPMPEVDVADLNGTMCYLQDKHFWTKARMQDGNDSDHPSTHVECTGSFWERFKASRSLKDMRFTSPMTVEDLLAAYYYRSLQVHQVVHVCKLGYCRASWASKCKFHLPWETVVEGLYLDDELQRQIPRRSNLDDDAWIKVHSLPLLVRSLMNVQTNQHHPHSGHRSLGYSLKYQLKTEPQTQIAVAHETDHAAVQFLRGQFVSISQASAFVLEDPVTESTQGVTPLALPSWEVSATRSCQGLWRRYVQRLPYREMDVSRSGYSRDVSGAEMQLSVIFASFLRLNRYFGDARDLGAECGDGLQANPSRAAEAAGPQLHPTKLSRHTWDGVLDDMRHPDFDPVLTELLPGEALISSVGARESHVFRKFRNGRLQFPRFIEYDLSFKLDNEGVQQRVRHFQARLFKYLPWLTRGGKDTTVIATIMSPLPYDIDMSTPALEPYVGVGRLRDYATLCASSQQTLGGIRVFWLQPKVIEDLKTMPAEAICLQLEQTFQNAGCVCDCCRAPSEKRCRWCYNAYGWHRCLRRCKACGDLASWVWRGGTLFDMQGQDVDACVLQMLDRAEAPHKIASMLDDLLKNDPTSMSVERHQELIKLVLARAGSKFDADPMFADSNQKLILTHSLMDEEPEVLKAKLEDLLQKMQNHWDFQGSCYRPWHAFVPPREVPSQFLAFDQLRLRLLQGHPIIVSIVAPAGFGKSELIAAWMLFTHSQKRSWATVAVTGVAATQVAGTTLHNFILLRTDGETALANDPDRCQQLRRLHGLIVDEAMMAEDRVIDKLAEIFREYPLLPSLRSPGALPFWGYRDIIFSGDIRQLCPASGGRPFWSRATFHKFFEVFRLREDRRHERDLYMQGIKEKIAWGGLPLEAAPTCNQQWQVDEAVKTFILEGFLRGWGMTGENVDLDVGTALFPRRADVTRWNNACVAQIDNRYGTACQAVNVTGFDPRGEGRHTPIDKVNLAGIQTPKVLQLRTCEAHRMRVMLLMNLDVSHGWANGTRARLLARDSWTAPREYLSQNPDGSFAVATVALGDKEKCQEFNVRVVKDDDASIAKAVRYNEHDFQMVHVGTESSGNQVWSQCQMTLAYALTGHKAQGLNMPITRIGLDGIFGFGLPYTLITRTPFQENIYFVGVPPLDVYVVLLHTGPDGMNPIERKQLEVRHIASSRLDLENIVEKRIASGEFDVKKTSREELFNSVQQHYLEWASRLDVMSGVKAMCQVSENFRFTPDGPVLKGGRPNAKWKSLGELLQQDDGTRQRILYYREIATTWMMHSTVDVLASARPGELLLPVRASVITESPFILGLIDGYTLEGALAARMPFPEAPQNFEWGVGFREKRKEKRPPPGDGDEPAENSKKDIGDGSMEKGSTEATAAAMRKALKTHIAISVGDRHIDLRRVSGPRRRIYHSNDPPLKKRRLVGKQPAAWKKRTSFNRPGKTKCSRMPTSKRRRLAGKQAASWSTALCDGKDEGNSEKMSSVLFSRNNTNDAYRKISRRTAVCGGRRQRRRQALEEDIVAISEEEVLSQALSGSCL